MAENKIAKINIGKDEDWAGRPRVLIDWWMDRPFVEGRRDTQHFIFECDAELLDLEQLKQRSYLEDATSLSWPGSYPRELIPEWINLVVPLLAIKEGIDA